MSKSKGSSGPAANFPADTAIVIGGGLAGMTAANTVLELGGKVVVLDKSSFCGGNSSKATSGINGCATKTQKAQGIDDSNELFLSDTLKGGAKKPEIAKVLVHESGPAVDWLMDTFALDLSLVARLGGHSAPRTHRGKERFPGMTITYALIQMIEKIQENTGGNMAQIITKARATDLISNNGAVIGVKYERQGAEIKVFGPVILATGGFGADFTSNSLLSKYRPDLMHLPTSNGEHCTGDGIKMGEAVGAATIDLEWVQVHPTGLVKIGDEDAKVKFLAAEALRGVGGLLLNAEGDRFANELGRRDYVTGEMWKNKAPFRLVLNSMASKEIHWHCEHYKGRGVMRKFDTGADLAKEMGIPVKKLEDVVEAHYQVSLKQAKDPEGGPYPAYPDGKSWDEPSGKTDCGKKFFHNVLRGDQVATETFHVAIVTPVIHYCMGGLTISAKSEVVNPKEKVIPGLYAAGEVAGGVHGNNRLGGSSLLDCVAFGRVAGRACAEYMLGADVTKTSLVTLAGGMPGQTESKPAASTAAAAPAAVEASSGYTLEEVAKHVTKDDCWVVLNGQVLDVTSFLKDHPGGELAILTFAGKDASAEFNMIHPPDVVQKYAPDCVIGALGGGGGSAAAGGAAVSVAASKGEMGKPEYHWWGPDRNRAADYGPIVFSFGWYFRAVWAMVVSFVAEILKTIFTVKNFTISGDRSGLTRSACLLILFIFVHAVGNLHVFGGPDHFNAYGYFYVRMYLFNMPLNFIELYILMGAALHVAVALRRTWQFKALKLFKTEPEQMTLVWTGVLLLAFGIVHLQQFRFGKTDTWYLNGPKWMWPFFSGHGSAAEFEGATPVRDIYKLEVELFQNGWWCLFYIGAVFVFGKHMMKGWSKLVATGGVLGVPAGHSQKANLIGRAATILICLMYFAFPLYCYFFPLHVQAAYL